MPELETVLQELRAEQKSYFDKAKEQERQHGTVLESTKNALAELQKQVDAIDVKLAQKQVADSEQGKTLIDELKENESVQKLMRDRRGNALISLSPKSAAEILERKTTITSTAVGAATSGVLQIERIPGIVPEARQALTVRDVLASRPTTMQVVDFVKVNTPMAIASPQTEASDKAQNAVTFTTVSEKVKTLATWIPATRQVLDDFTELMGFLRSTLPYYVNLEEELQLLSGDNTGENLHGLIGQATAFNTAFLSASKGWNKIDMIGRVIQQITTAKELPPTFTIVHPNDWWDIRLTKDSYGRYILGDPQTNVRPSLFGLDVVPTTSIAASTFLVGSGSPIASEIRDRMDMQVDISTEHSDYFIKNMVAVRAEKRLTLVVKRPVSYVTGTFNSSPA